MHILFTVLWSGIPSFYVDSPLIFCYFCVICRVFDEFEVYDFARTGCNATEKVGYILYIHLSAFSLFWHIGGSCI